MKNVHICKPDNSGFPFSLFSSVFGILGALLVALGAFFVGYVFFFVGSVCGIIACKTDKSLAIQFYAFTLCNVIGLVNNWPF